MLELREGHPRPVTEPERALEDDRLLPDHDASCYQTALAELPEDDAGGDGADDGATVADEQDQFL